MLDDGTTFQQPLFVSIPFKYLLIDTTGKYIGQIGFQLRKLSCTVKEIHPPVIIKQKRTVMEMRGARKKFPGDRPDLLQYRQTHVRAHHWL